MEKTLRDTVIIVRDFPEQLTGGDLVGEEAFRQACRTGRRCGHLHRTLRQRTDCVIRQIDPRNQVALFVVLCREVWRHRPGLLTGLRTVCMAFALPAVIVNGRVLACGHGLDDPCLVPNVLQALQPA